MYMCEEEKKMKLRGRKNGGGHYDFPVRNIVITTTTILMFFPLVKFQPSGGKHETECLSTFGRIHGKGSSFSLSFSYDFFICPTLHNAPLAHFMVGRVILCLRVFTLEEIHNVGH